MVVYIRNPTAGNSLRGKMLQFDCNIFYQRYVLRVKFNQRSNTIYIIIYANYP